MDFFFALLLSAFQIHTFNVAQASSSLVILNLNIQVWLLDPKKKVFDCFLVHMKEIKINLEEYELQEKKG